MTGKVLKLRGIQVQDYMKVKLVNLRLDGKNLVISGPNGAGKTTILQAIWNALEAKSPRQPIRGGADKATITLDLGDLIVKRTITEKGSYLTVSTPDGANYQAPQQMLDKLRAKIALDPHQFIQQPDLQQYRELLEIVPLGLDLDQWEKDYQAQFEERTAVNRDVKALEARLEGMEEPSADLPEEEVSVSALAQKLNQATEEVRKTEEFRRDLAGLHAECEGLKVRVSNIDAEIARLQDERKTVTAQLEQKIARGKKMKAELEAKTLPDVEAIRASLEEAERVNSNIRAAARYRELMADLTDVKGRADALTAALDALKQAKEDALKKAAMPIEGLGVGDRCITYNGIPFKQISHAEQIRVALALLMAQNPGFHFFTVKDASLLDTDSWKAITEMAEKHDFQPIFEVVSSSPGAGVYIEDGTVTAIDGEPVKVEEPEKPLTKDHADPSTETKESEVDEDDWANREPDLFSQAK